MSRGIARAYTRIDGESDATPASLQLVSSNFFEVLRVSPVLGRTLSSSANAFLADTHAAIISHGYWSRRFGASPDVVGRTLTINGVSFTVTGWRRDSSPAYGWNHRSTYGYRSQRKAI